MWGHLTLFLSLVGAQCHPQLCEIPRARRKPSTGHAVVPTNRLFMLSWMILVTSQTNNGLGVGGNTDRGLGNTSN
eukprot:409135-Amphidinium_carterae.1